MRLDALNGMPIPYDLPTSSLEVMLSSGDMKEFSLACEALSYKNEPEAYETLKAYKDDKDKYRRLYVLKTIFRHRMANELVDYLKDAILSDDFLFVRNGLLVIIEHGVDLNEDIIIWACKRWIADLNTELLALGKVNASEEHYADIVSIFKKAQRSEQKECVADVLMDRYLETRHDELYRLFLADRFGKIRLRAAMIGIKYGYDMAVFCDDPDGHIRAFIKNYT